MNAYGEGVEVSGRGVRGQGLHLIGISDCIIKFGSLVY